jgi:hypothetical protein
MARRTSASSRARMNRLWACIQKIIQVSTPSGQEHSHSLEHFLRRPFQAGTDQIQANGGCQTGDDGHRHALPDGPALLHMPQLAQGT